MAFSNLTNSQMVSFTDAQSGGFALNSGQSHVTSNQCMTKNDAITKYNLNASSMSAYSSNQLVPKNTWANPSTYYAFNRTTGSGSADGSCTFSYVGVLYANVSYPTIGTIMYTNTGLTTTFIGADFWYGMDSTIFGLSYKINNYGQIIESFDCGF